MEKRRLFRIIKLKTLVLCHGDIDSKGIKWLSEALKSNQSLTTLSLCQSFIGSEGINWLSEGLKINNSLTNLTLYKTSIGLEGEVQRLSEALKINRSLTYLSLRYNKIDGEGCKWLSEALKVNQSLTSLDLQQNKISSEGCRRLSESLKVNISLINLDIYGNVIMGEGYNWLSEALKINQSLTILNIDLYAFDIPGSVWFLIHQLIDDNKKRKAMMAYQLITLQVILLPTNRGFFSPLPNEIMQTIVYHLGYPDYLVSFNQLTRIYKRAIQRGSLLDPKNVSQRQRYRKFVKAILSNGMGGDDAK